MARCVIGALALVALFLAGVAPGVGGPNYASVALATPPPPPPPGGPTPIFRCWATCGVTWLAASNEANPPQTPTGRAYADLGFEFIAYKPPPPPS